MHSSRASSPWNGTRNFFATALAQAWRRDALITARSQPPFTLDQSWGHWMFVALFVGRRWLFRVLRGANSAAHDLGLTAPGDL